MLYSKKDKRTNLKIHDWFEYNHIRSFRHCVGPIKAARIIINFIKYTCMLIFVWGYLR